VLKCVGLNSKASQDAVRTLVDSSRADIVCLQETKMANIPRRVILFALESDFDNFVTLPAAESAGCLATSLWVFSEFTKLIPIV
jgi:exonuclease III